MAKRKEYVYAKKVARELCDDQDQMRYVLTAVAAAVEERLGEDIILCPRERRKTSTKATTTPAGEALSVKFMYKNRPLWRHYIYYGPPSGDPPSKEELLRITLDVAHELGLLILDRGPGRMDTRIGISKNDLEDVRRVEADWFALCVLQMYGFLSREK